MSENSRGRFTITLGRSGQVVNRGRNVSDIEANDSYRVSGIKRSVRDRLGSNGGSSSFNGSLYSNKRHREDSAITGLTTSGMEDARIGSRDLRHKLLGKKLSRASESSSSQRVMDLREKLPRLQEPPLSRYDRPKQISESRESSMLGRVAESRGSSILGRSAESREGSMLGRMPESRGSSIWRGMPESRESSIWRGMPESRESSIFGRVPIRSRAETFPRMDSSRSDYSPWTLDHIRQRSPERLANSSLGFSLRRNLEEPQRRPAEQTYDGVRGVPCVGKKEMHDPPRPITASPMMSSSRLPTSSARLMPPPPPLLSQIPPPAGTLQNGPYNTDEPQTVDGLLNSLGLGKYAISFKAEEVDMASLRQMGENDLKELGIPMGPRKKIVLALLPRSKRQP